MTYIRSFVRFWVDFIIGDDWRIALGVVMVMAVGAWLAAADVSGDVLAPTLAVAVMAVAGVSIVVGARRR